MGWGKSTCLVAFVVDQFFNHPQQRTMFLPDCCILVISPVLGMKLAMAVAWANDPVVLDKICRLETKGQIEWFFADLRESCIFIVDQYDALDTASFPDRRGLDTIRESDKEAVRGWIHTISRNHSLVLCSSANVMTERYATIQQPAAPRASEKIVYLTGGYNKVESLSFDCPLYKQITDRVDID